MSDDSRLTLTLSGPAGVGKTNVATCLTHAILQGRVKGIRYPVTIDDGEVVIDIGKPTPPGA